MPNKEFKKIKLVQLYSLHPSNDGPTRNLFLNTKQLILFMDLSVNLILILYYDYRRLLLIKNIVLLLYFNTESQLNVLFILPIILFYYYY